jgi:ABC-type nitrate/sulfonate/bicarbonate transport system substrate-binding protein
MHNLVQEVSVSDSVLDTLWYTRCPVPTASSIAIELGMLDAEFAADNIRTASLRASSDRSVRESHFDHAQRRSFREGGNIPPIWSRSRGADTRLIGASWVEQYQAIIALPESGISSGVDLRGRRLGISAHTHDQIDFWRARALRGMLTGLALAGLSAEDADIVYLPEEETFLGDDAPSQTGTLWTAKQQQRIQRREMFALIRGEVDAIFVTSARGVQLEALLGAVRVVDLAAYPDRDTHISNSVPIVFTVSGELLREQPELVRRYLNCVRTAARWAQSHARETRRIVAAEMGDAEEWVDISYGTELATSLEPDLSDERLAAVESQKDFLLEHGFIESDFSVREWAAPELYDA